MHKILMKPGIEFMNYLKFLIRDLRNKDFGISEDSIILNKKEAS
ncbi:MAG: hypothetical protein WCY40_03995 [Defluviitoga tunisiensis]|nr:hypothetical protein [Defluviitoga tunisiensis]